MSKKNRNGLLPNKQHVPFMPKRNSNYKNNFLKAKLIFNYKKLIFNYKSKTKLTLNYKNNLLKLILNYKEILNYQKYYFELQNKFFKLYKHM